MDTDEPTLFGAAYSVYVRAVRLVLEEKGVPYRLVEIDVFAPGGPPAAYLARHPFGRIPAFEHAGLALYESGAIERYVDEAFEGPALQPKSAAGRAQMNQVIGIVDSYAYRTLVWDIFVERVRAPAQGRLPNEAGIAAALPRARTCLAALATLMGDGPWISGSALTLADLHAAPIFAYFRMASEGVELLAQYPRLAGWLDAISGRKSMSATRSPLEPD
jgi:glutathione S-transferase